MIKQITSRLFSTVSDLHQHMLISCLDLHMFIYYLQLTITLLTSSKIDYTFHRLHRCLPQTLERRQQTVDIFSMLQSRLPLHYRNLVYRFCTSKKSINEENKSRYWIIL